MQREGPISDGSALQGSAVPIETPRELSRFVRAEPFAIVHFEAPWCTVCRDVQALLDTVPVTVASVDVEQLPTIAMDYGVETLPTLVVFKDGDPVARHRGRLDEAELHSIVGRFG